MVVYLGPSLVVAIPRENGFLPRYVQLFLVVCAFLMVLLRLIYFLLSLIRNRAGVITCNFGRRVTPSATIAGWRHPHGYCRPIVAGTCSSPLSDQSINNYIEHLVF
jgi:hypothetical protein